MNDEFAAVILAAGHGTRMKSKVAKVLHPVAGKPMIEYAVDTARFAGVEKTVVVVGHQGDQVHALLGDRVIFAEQSARLGTGDAVKCARGALDKSMEHILVFYADMPLFKPETIRALVDKHLASGATLTHADRGIRRHDEFWADSARLGWKSRQDCRRSRGHAAGTCNQGNQSRESIAFRAEWLWKNLECAHALPQKRANII